MVTTVSFDKLIITLFVLSFVTNTLCQGYKKGVPSGYWYFKLHTTPKTWDEAIIVCQSENAQLAIINSEEEAKLFADELERHPPSSVRGVYGPAWTKDIAMLGFHDRFKEGNYVTIDGKPLAETGYVIWHEGQPDNENNNEKCGSMFRSGRLNDCPCNVPYMFFCKKKDSNKCDQILNEDAPFNNGYKKGVPTGYSYFKLHTTPKTWTQALQVCQSENAQLAIINSEEEARLYSEEFGKHPSSSLTGIPGPKWSKDVAMLGFHDMFINDYYLTIDGKPLAESGYTTWARGQPDNEQEKCGSMFRNGMLNDLPCNNPYVFFCETKYPFSSEDDIEIEEPDENGYLKSTPSSYWYFKLHTTPKTWHEAIHVCQLEKAQLAVITSQEEANLFANEIANHPHDTITGIIGPEWGKDIALLGFHDRYEEGNYITIDGMPLAESGYTVWENGQPDNENNMENCGSMFRSGRLNDCPCHFPYMFFCKKIYPNKDEREANNLSHDEGYKKGIPANYWYFKLHTNPKTWHRANLVCKSENAELAVVNSEPEAKLFAKEMAKHPANTVTGITGPEWSKDVAMLGFHDRFVEGHYITIDGTPLSDTGYSKWHPGEPDNENNNENCGSMFRTGLLNDLPCHTPYMFFCKTRNPLKKHEEKIGKGYKRGVDQFFKLHTQPKTWEQAVEVCKSENAKLAVINSQEEANLFAEELAEYPASVVSKNFNLNVPDWYKDVALLGFHDKFAAGHYITTDGLPLSETGYIKWEKGQPDNQFNNEHCGSMFRNGRLNDLPCNLPFMFFCKTADPFMNSTVPQDGIKCVTGKDTFTNGEVQSVQQTTSISTDDYQNTTSELSSSVNAANHQLIVDFLKTTPETTIRFRRDYIYMDVFKQFVKINTKRRSWPEAKAYCEMEGASLAVIKTSAEAAALKDIVKKIPNSENTWIGLQDLLAEGEFETIDNESITTVFDEWERDKPNDPEGNKDCVLFTLNGQLKDEVCSLKYPFICKKDAITVTPNDACDNFDLEYKLVLGGQQCIKLHRKPRTWEDAYITCSAEQSHLAIIDIEEEADLYKSIFAKYPAKSLIGDFRKDILLIGFHSKFEKGNIVTIQNQKVSTTKYNVWGEGQPENSKPDEKCGSMLRDGKLNLVACNVKAIFICEKDLYTPLNSSVDV